MSLERDANLIALAHVFPADEFPYPSQEVEERWQSLLADPAVAVCVADSPLGSPPRLVACVAWDSRRLRHLAVHPDQWGTGLARAAIDLAVSRMQEPRLWVLDANDRARAVYAHLGWVPTGRTGLAEFPPFPPQHELHLPG